MSVVAIKPTRRKNLCPDTQSGQASMPRFEAWEHSSIDEKAAALLMTHLMVYPGVVLIFSYSHARESHHVYGY